MIGCTKSGVGVESEQTVLMQWLVILVLQKGIAAKLERTMGLTNRGLYLSTRYIQRYPKSISIFFITSYVLRIHSQARSQLEPTIIWCTQACQCSSSEEVEIEMLPGPRLPR